MGLIACAMHTVVYKEEPHCRDDGRVCSPSSFPILLARDRASEGWAGSRRGAGSAGVVSDGRGLHSPSPRLSGLCAVEEAAAAARGPR